MAYSNFLTQMLIGIVVPDIGMPQVGNWVLCDGRALSIEDYPKAYEVLGTSFGHDGEGTFRIPDLRGVFIRYKDNGAGIDPGATSRTSDFIPGSASGDNVGSYQTAALKNHSHVFGNVTEPIRDSAPYDGTFESSKYQSGQVESESVTAIEINPEIDPDSSSISLPIDDIHPINTRLDFYIKVLD